MYKTNVCRQYVLCVICRSCNTSWSLKVPVLDIENAAFCQFCKIKVYQKISNLNQTKQQQKKTQWYCFHFFFWGSLYLWINLFVVLWLRDLQSFFINFMKKNFISFINQLSSLIVIKMSFLKTNSVTVTYF